MPKLSIWMLSNDKAEEMVKFYKSIFKNFWTKDQAIKRFRGHCGKNQKNAAGHEWGHVENVKT